MPKLFDPIQFRSVTIPNRIGLSPMCMYSCENGDGMATEWHHAHLSTRAVGGCGLVMTEATAVTPAGRISPQDLGIWNDDQAEALAPIVRFIASRGAVPGIQLAHAGRKASTFRPWSTERGWIPVDRGGWVPWAPSPIPFQEGAPIPQELSKKDIAEMVDAFCQAARRSLATGFKVIELHAAHGYLIHEFLSPLSNSRQDEYGGPFENRTRVVRELVTALRGVWPEELPLFLRVSSTDWVEGGWSLNDTVELAKMVRPLGVDLVDCSSGGTVPKAQIPVGPGYQVDFAARIRNESGVATAAVGLILDEAQASRILAEEKADMVFLGRLLLRDPYWPLRVARETGQPLPWPSQYLRAVE